MKSTTRKKILKRFNELAIKECKGTITAAEREKLERYDRLRDSFHPEHLREERSIIQKNDWELRWLLKKIAHFTHTAL